jgi:hypothetical protein
MTVKQTPVLQLIRNALKSVRAPRLFKTERGYQGELLAELKKRLPKVPGLDNGAMVEQEYQKRYRDHGLRIRPDILIHCPFDAEHHPDRKVGNFVAFALKLKAGPKKAAADYKNLLLLMETLGYPFGVFVNIDSVKTHIAKAPKPKEGRLFGFATRLHNGRVTVYEKDAT